MCLFKVPSLSSTQIPKILVVYTKYMAYLKSYWFDININILYTCHIPGIYLIYDNVNSYIEYIPGIYFT